MPDGGSILIQSHGQPDKGLSYGTEGEHPADEGRGQRSRLGPGWEDTSG